MTAAHRRTRPTPTPRTLTIGVHFDLVCPWCLIGKRQLDVARARFREERTDVAVAIAWHPLQLLPDVPEQGLDFAVFYEQRLGSAEAVRLRRQQVTRAAEQAGIALDLAGIARMPNTARAHRLLQRVAASGDAVLHEALLARLFAAYFQLGQDIGDARTLHALALAVGVPEATAAPRADDSAPLPVGVPVTGVPYFSFGAHLALSGARDATDLLQSMRQAVGAIDPVAA